MSHNFSEEITIKEIKEHLAHIESYGYTLGTDKHWLIHALKVVLEDLDYLQFMYDGLKR